MLIAFDGNKTPFNETGMFPALETLAAGIAEPGIADQPAICIIMAAALERIALLKISLGSTIA